MEPFNPVSQADLPNGEKAGQKEEPLNKVSQSGPEVRRKKQSDPQLCGKSKVDFNKVNPSSMKLWPKSWVDEAI